LVNIARHLVEFEVTLERNICGNHVKNELLAFAPQILTRRQPARLCDVDSGSQPAGSE